LGTFENVVARLPVRTRLAERSPIAPPPLHHARAFTAAFLHPTFPQALEDAANYGALAELPGYPARLLGKQLWALRLLAEDLAAALRAADAAAAALGRAARAAAATARQDRRLTPAARAATVGPVPSVDSLLAGLAGLAEARAAECRLLRALVAEARYDSAAEEVVALRRAAAARVHLDAAREADLFAVVEAAGEAAARPAR
jgi:hypothetical protein